jgi:hypothetical protein
MSKHNKITIRTLARNILVIMFLANFGTVFANQVFWQDSTPAARSMNTEITSIRRFSSDEPALRSFLFQVPNESSGITGPTIMLPMPDGSLARYSIVESAIMEDGLAAKYPEIKTFKVYGIDDPIASGRVGISPKGFSAMLHTSQGRVFIDPDTATSAPASYMARTSGSADNQGDFQCGTDQAVSGRSSLQMSSARVANRVAGDLMTYRLAVSATPEYVTAVQGSGTPLEDAIAEIIKAINRVNQIYEHELGIRLVLVADNDLLIDVNNVNNFSNDNNFALLAENQLWIDTIIGNGSYDIGHIFNTSGGGSVALISSVCNTSRKAQGVSDRRNPTGDAFYMDYIAHEIGHQFSAKHSFNGTTRYCAGSNRNGPTAFEPGSGSTIMSYSGSCGVESLQAYSDATFHAGSVNQINAFTAAGGSCNGITNTGNSDPTNVAAGVDRTIPIATAFRLEGSGTDLNDDTLSYQWDQMDLGTATTADTFGEDLGDNPLFRNYMPRESNVRDFPALGTQVRDGPFDQSEAMPCTSRSLNFRLTVTDGKSGQGTDDVRINVDSNSGPFRITSHNEAGTTVVASAPDLILTWAVGNTDQPPVNCADVDIDLLTFSTGFPTHETYSVTSLKSATPNDGVEVITLMPVRTNSLARLRVKCSNNIFYDISDADIDIQGNSADGFYSTTGNMTDFNSIGQVFATSSSCTVVAPEVVVPESPVAAVPTDTGGGGGVFDELLLFFQVSLLAGLNLLRRPQLGLVGTSQTV